MEKSSIDFRATSRLVSAMRCLAAGVLLTFCAVTRADVPSGPELLEAEHALSMEFETPHTKWAKPYAQGPTRVLFFAPWYQGGTECREIIELMQRFDLEADAVYCFPPGDRLVGDGDPRWYGDPELATKRLLRLLEKPYDVIFMNQIALANLNEKAKAAVLAAVEQGTGLVYVGDEDMWGSEAFSPQALVAVKGAPPQTWLRAAYTFGKGRVFQVVPRAKLTFEHGWETLFDYQMADQGRMLLWAANRLPRGELHLSYPNTGDDSATTNIISTDSPRVVGPLTLEWATGPAGSTIQVNLRVPSGGSWQLLEVDASQPGQIPVPVPDLRAGNYNIDAFLRGDHGIEAWTSTSWTVDTVETISTPDLEKAWAEPGEQIAGSATLAEPKPGDAVFVRVFDTTNRLLFEQFASISVDDASFLIPTPTWYPMLVRVELARTRDGREISASHAYVRITNRKQNQFHFVLWNAHSTDLAPYGAQAMAKYGVTSVLQNQPLLSLSAANLAFVPYAASFRASSHSLTAMLDDNGVLKSGCVHDEVGMAKFVSETVARAQEAREHGTFVYSLGDENAVRASCLSEHCRKAYQDYLNYLYGSIEALNASWGSTYTSFDEVDVQRDGELPAADAPQWFKEYYAQNLVKNQTDDEVTGPKQIELGDINDEIRALQDENFARWYDRQDFQNWSYVQWCKRFVKAFREIDPHSLTGFEGTDSFSIRRLTTRSRQGGDLDLFMREMEYFGPYHNPANEVVRSLAKGNFPRGNWIGYSMDPDVELGFYWNQITNGFNAIQWWRLDNVGQGYHGFLAPDMAPSPTSRALIEDTQIVRDGLGDLLMRYPMLGDGVAMLYSIPSTYIAHFDGNESYGLYVRDHEHWIDALHDAGLQFDYVTDRQLRLGEFDASKYKVLILPLAFAIGDKEAEVIRAFVAGGGTLIADVRPGTYNDRCKPREKGVLDDVFGIKRTGKQAAVSLDRMRVQGELNGAPLYMEWGNWYGKDIYPQMHTDPTVELTTGEALGWNFPIHYHHGLKHPAAIMNSHGAGKAILLNFSVYPAPFDDLLGQVLVASGVRPAVEVRETTVSQKDRTGVARLLDEAEQVPAAGAAAPGAAGDTGEHPEGVELTRWKNGDVELIALLGKQSKELIVTLPEARHVFNIKTKESLGSVAEFPVQLHKARASFFALLPEAATAPVIDFGIAESKPGSVLTPTITVPGPIGPRALKLHLTGPGDKWATWIADHIVIESSQGNVTIPFALNDPTGEWTLHAEDILTGAGSTHTIQLR